MNGNDVFLVRGFEPENDLSLVNGWLREHGRPEVPSSMLPKLGIVVFHESTEEDYAALWLYMDNSTGVCFAERAVARPRLSIEGAKAALLRGLDYLKHEARALGYGVMFVRCYPAMGRFLDPREYFEDDRPVSCFFTTTEEK